MPSKWIWFPGDFAIYLGNRVMERREQQGKMIASAWRVDLPAPSVFFKKKVAFSSEKTIRVYALGRVSVRCEGDNYRFSDADGVTYHLTPGEYELNITVYNPGKLPALYVDGDLQSGDGWTASVGWFGAPNLPAEYGDFASPDDPPTNCRFRYETETPVSKTETEQGILYDFGRETFGYLTLAGAKEPGEVMVYYGESREEALDLEFCETSDRIAYTAGDTVCPNSRAMRYVHVLWKEEKATVSLKAELLDVPRRGEFTSADERMNQIYELSYRTLHLCARETLLDGIKRDRWYWSGDATESYLMNFYSFFDEDLNRRTMWAIRGKDPLETHLNLILDYSFYWLISLYDHYLYAGDVAFLRKIYPRAKTLMEFCEGNLNENGFVVGRNGDWVFMDWADMDMGGEICVEQILFWKAYRSMATVAHALTGSDAGYGQKADALKERIMEVFWDEERGVFLHSRKDGDTSHKLTRYAGIFAILYDFVDEDKKRRIAKNMILTDALMPITTPYMQFYEMCALLEVGEGEEVTRRIKDYWGGMLDLGATSVWELYDPQATDHYAMYGRPFSKSLCHAWGAGPIYLFGRYYLGVYPTSPHYATYRVEPHLCGLSAFSGKVPTPGGEVWVSVTPNAVSVGSHTDGDGVLLWEGKEYFIPPHGSINLER